MHHDETPATHNATTSGPSEEIQRLELLSWRFSSVEIDRLSRLQLRFREHPQVIDFPLEERRLWFARWLVEHGRIGAGDGVGIEKQLAESERSAQPPLQERAAPQPDATWPPEHTVYEAWHRQLLSRVARAWRCVVEAVRLGCEAVGQDYLASEYAQWYPGPHGPYDHPRSHTAAQLFWLGYMPIH
jgi:hypothetical protein